MFWERRRRGACVWQEVWVCDWRRECWLARNFMIKTKVSSQLLWWWDLATWIKRSQCVMDGWRQADRHSDRQLPGGPLLNFFTNTHVSCTQTHTLSDTHINWYTWNTMLNFGLLLPLPHWKNDCQSIRCANEKADETKGEKGRWSPLCFWYSLYSALSWLWEAI